MSQQKEVGWPKHEVDHNDNDGEEPTKYDEMEGLGKSENEGRGLGRGGLSRSFVATSFTV